MKKVRAAMAYCILTTGLVFGVTGCPEVNPSEMTGMDSPTANELFRLVTVADPFEEWVQFPEAQGLVESATPHGPMARVWINGEVQNAIAGFNGSLPKGSIILKENLGESTSEKANAWTIMWKVSGYDRDNNDWFWANVKPDGEVISEGRIEGCINCHSSARENDFVFLHDFTQD